MEAHLLAQHPCSIFTRPQLPYHHPTRAKTPYRFSHSGLSCSVRYRPWNSNADTSRSSQKFNLEDDEDEGEDQDSEPGFGGGRGRKKNRRRWWSDEPSSMPEMEERSGGIFEEAIDSIWIFKVFRSYGWTLPAIFLSLLLSSGPKAFLMALAVPLGQSALSLAFEKLWGRAQSKPKRKSRMRRKPSASNVSGVEMAAEEEEDESQESRRGKVGYQSWVAGNEGSVSNGRQDAASFGGWDELDRSRLKRKSYRMSGESRQTTTEKAKLSRRERKSGTPLLLRLLIAVFPFLGSWTKML